MRLSAIVFASFMAGSLAAQDVASQIEEYVSSLVKAGKFSGSVLAARDGKVLLSKGYGMANLELDVPNTPQTKFRLGSITKQFVTAAILQLEEKGKLSVADPVCKYVPDCPAAWGKITIHHLMSHTSGIPNFTSFPDYPKTWMLPSRPEQTLLRFTDKPLDFEPGTKWSYSNSGYILLGYILEKASGMRYEDYLRKNVLDPAGMADSGHDTHEEILKNRATGYSRGSGEKWVNSAYHDMSIPIGGGDLYSTVEDMYKWDQALTPGRVLSGESLRRALTPVKNRYGYGWGIDKQYGRPRYSHGGGINGFSTFFARFPEEKAVVVVLGNTDFGATGDVAAAVTRSLFGAKYVRPEDRKEISVDPGRLPAYVGQYELESGGKATVSVESGKLHVMLPNAAREEVFPEAEDTFFYRTTDRQLEFRRNPAGAVTGMVIHRHGTESEAVKVSSEVPALPKEVALSPEALAELTGEYELAPGFSIVVTAEDGKLFGQATGQPKFELFAEAKDKFFLKVVEAKIDFERGPDGKVTGLILHQGGRDMPAKRK